jgi:hypothetical protein
VVFPGREIYIYPDDGGHFESSIRIYHITSCHVLKVCSFLPCLANAVSSTVDGWLHLHDSVATASFKEGRVGYCIK